MKGRGVLVSDWGELRGFADDWRIKEPREQRALDPLFGVELVEGWLEDPFGQYAALEIYEWLTHHVMRPPSTRDIRDLVIPRLRQAIEREEIVLLGPAPAPTVGPPRPRPQEKPPEPPKPRVPRRIRERSFIDVRVVDRRGRPLAGYKYKLEYPDGRVETGVLDGGARLFRSELDPGTGRLTLLPSEGPTAAEPPAPTSSVPLDLEARRVRVLSEEGQPLEDVVITFASLTRSEPVPTNVDGDASTFVLPRARLMAAIADPERLSARLATMPPGDAAAPLPADAVLIRLGHEMDPVPLESPQPATLVVLRPTRRIRLAGLLFETDKCFLLPSAVVGLREVENLYVRYPGSNLLIVGHTDRAGRAPWNMQLSLERADAVRAYLTQDVEVWLPFFEHPRAEKRWGLAQIQHMLSALPPDNLPYYNGPVTGLNDAVTDAAVRRFQSDHGLRVDGDPGPLTRRALVDNYMRLQGGTTPSEHGISLTVHGCGESFPDVALPDGSTAAADRRVEIFVFNGPITPPPQGPTSGPDATDYPAWRARLVETTDVTQGIPLTGRRVALTLLDAERRPVAGQPYTLTGGGETFSGATSAEGKLEHVFAEETTRAVLSIGDSRIDLELSELPPADTLLGAQERLINLLYLDGPASGQLDDGTRAALLAFQQDEVGDAGSRTGQLNPPTVEALRRVYGH